MEICFLVFLGAGAGGVVRHLVNLYSTKMLGINLPYGTLMVNVVGSFLMGMIASYFALKGEGNSQHLRLFLATGFLGGFTTFSAFSLEIVLLYERGEMLLAFGYALTSVILGVLSLCLGLYLSRLSL